MGLFTRPATAVTTTDAGDLPVDQLFNLVVLPMGDPGVPRPLFQVSATRCDRHIRLVSPVWDESALRLATSSMGVTNVQLQNLIRGNRMANGGRDPRRTLFTEQQLREAGLAEPVASEAEDPVSAG